MFYVHVRLSVAVARSMFSGLQYVIYFRFVDDVTFAHNRPRKGDANRVYTQ